MDPVVTEPPPPNELPAPALAALEASVTDPRAVARDKAHLIQPHSPIAHPDYFQVHLPSYPEFYSRSATSKSWGGGR